MMMPPIMLIGADTMIARPMKTTICTWVTSLVLREIRVGAPNRETSWAENSPTRWKIAARRSRPIPMEEREERYTARTVARIWATLTASIHPPVLTM